MRRSRSPLHPGGNRKLTRCDLSERPLQVAPEAQSDLARVTPRGRSYFYRVTTTQWSRSDLSERHTEVAPEAWSDAEKSLAFSSLGDTKMGPERRIAATPPGRSRSLERLLEVAARLFSKLDHPRSNPYAHEFSFPLSKKNVDEQSENASWKRGHSRDNSLEMRQSDSFAKVGRAKQQPIKDDVNDSSSEDV
ncbi:hypothetical protein F2Q69_00002497 [Brassica cretica]|uniref:Uncharacterized protein n=1 Tax=Brassica cretica TaxID=69181 RepID=A0A8S9PKA1_BRACR|nr:hypothetical protein F2Q69_00002497 [Brassica cretica]